MAKDKVEGPKVELQLNIYVGGHPWASVKTEMKKEHLEGTNIEDWDFAVESAADYLRQAAKKAKEKK